MKVAPTDAGGRVGRFVAANLLARGCRVRGLTKSGTVPAVVEPVTGDFTDPLQAFVQAEGGDWHLAALRLTGLYAVLSPVEESR